MVSSRQINHRYIMKQPLLSIISLCFLCFSLSTSPLAAKDTQCSDTIDQACIVSTILTHLEELETTDQRGVQADMATQILLSADEHAAAFSIALQHGQHMHFISLAAVAVAFGRMDQPQKAQAIFKLANAAAIRQEQETFGVGLGRHKPLFFIAKQQIGAGLADAGRQTLQQIASLAKSANTPASLLSKSLKVAHLQRLAGWFDDLDENLRGSVEIAKNQPLAHAEHLGAIAVEYVLAGFEQKGMALIELLKQELARPNMPDNMHVDLIDITAAALLQIGLHEQAMDLVEKHNYSDEFDSILLKAIRNIIKDQPLKDIVPVPQEIYHQALQLANQIKDSELQAQAYYSIALAQTETGAHQDALDTVSLLDNEKYRLEMFYDVITTIAQQDYRKNPDFLVEIVEKYLLQNTPLNAANISDFIDPSLFILIADGYIHNGENAKAQSYVELVFSQLRTQIPRPLLTMFFYVLAQIGPDAKPFEKLELFTDLDNLERAQILFTMAQGFGENGHFDAANRIISELEQSIGNLPENWPEILNMNLHRIYVAISLSYTKTGNLEKAKLYLQQAEEKLPGMSMAAANLFEAKASLAKAHLERGDSETGNRLLRDIYSSVLGQPKISVKFMGLQHILNQL